MARFTDPMRRATQDEPEPFDRSFAHLSVIGVELDRHHFLLQRILNNQEKIMVDQAAMTQALSDLSASLQKISAVQLEELDAIKNANNTGDQAAFDAAAANIETQAKAVSDLADAATAALHPSGATGATGAAPAP